MACCAVSCSSRTTKGGVKDPELSFHTFPKCPEIRLEWIRAVRRDNWEPSKYSRLCSKHFEKSCYVTGLSIKRLKSDAVPTIFEGYPVYYQPVIKKRKPPQNRNTLAEDIQITPRKRRRMQQIGIDTEDIPTTPRRGLKILRSLAQSRMVATRRLKTIKKIRESKRRLIKKNATLMNVINDLKNKNLVERESLDLLSCIGSKCKDLLVRLKRKTKNESLPKEYSPELRKFSLTLHYLSPRAYKYVRSNFDSCLPHPKTITKWYQAVNCEPGFTKESFETLKLRSQKELIIGALSIDEMAIRKCIEWDGRRSHGYVNIGNNVDNDSVPVATEVLTFMMTAVNGSYKIPVGYFLINGITGLQKAELVRTCLDLFAESGVSIVALTFDGAANNIAMAKHLGCNLNFNNNFKTQFAHNGMKISIFLDPCHCLKLVRNALGDKGCMFNEEGKEISFKYFKLLHDLQTQEKMHLANKLRQAHIDYIKQKMKVKLAAQLLSQSVADALEFCRNDIKLPEFEDCQATCDFICMFNNIFDLLNSRNLNSYGFTKPIVPRNLSATYRLISDGMDYIKNLKMNENEFIIESQRKVGFLGFLICLKSLKNICEGLLTQNPPKLTFISTYKFSQDHLELFFGAIRSMGGFNNNPSAKQFRAAYKKLLVHAEFKIAEGNCIPLEDIPILNLSSSHYVNSINKSLIKSRMIEEIDDTVQRSHYAILDYNDDHCYEFDPSQISEYAAEVIYYISGFVVKKIKSNLNCEECLSALEGPKRNSLTMVKDKGGLIYPSHDVYQICKLCGKVLRKYLISTHHSKITNKDLYKMIREVILHVVQSFNYMDIFQSLNAHVEYNFLDNHKYLLMKSICEKYFQLRIHFVMKNAVVESSVRNMYTKLILFKGH